VRILAALIVASAFSLGGCATTPQRTVWDADKLAHIATTSPSPTIKLWHGTRDNVVLEIPREQVVTITEASLKIQAAAGFHIHRHFISDEKDVNAFATTNAKGERIVVINRGMVEALGNDKDAWAGLLGHEIAHHVKSHGATRGEAKAGAYMAGQAVATAVGFIPIGGPIASMLISSAAGTATQMAVYGSYTRPQEEEADRLGLQWMVAAGYDPAGMLRLMQTLARKSEIAMPALLSTHPVSDERIKSVEAFIVGQQAKGWSD
jgi:predicted Zn-dependent protease